MSRTLQIILGTPANRKAVLAVMQDCFAGRGEIFTKAHETAVSQLLVDPSAGRIYLVEIRGQLAGLVSVAFQQSVLLANKLAVLELIFLKEDFRNRGLAQRILRSVAGDLEAFGQPVVAAYLDPSDPFCRLFELEGFSEKATICFMDCPPPDMDPDDTPF
ncbi:GNAT family N-acetyltransferase [Roseibium denhamense]|uniref:Acetyltransferase (GNAT) family protein n=1 Tax=Roseibium denhamense TaxID=76305 RepID=A0ABY1P4I6_9HYPH|nr:GNAT family N-acetyltransferase [Roseibium denhamense]MTI07704.1 GNAT family N-acetyltransferase [Roseibium denhamense]SMP24753.1 Acetyltransferase (GNAT) family protein [Roseibium denhamense]